MLRRTGYTERGVDLCALTGLPRAGVLCGLVNEDEEGTMMERDNLRALADRRGLKMVSMEMIQEWRWAHEGINTDGNEMWLVSVRSFVVL